MEKQFNILKEKFEIYALRMEMCELDDEEIVFEIKQNEVERGQLEYINDFMEDMFSSNTLISIECIDHRQFLTYRYLK